MPLTVVNWVPSIVVALPAEQMLIRNVFHFFTKCAMAASGTNFEPRAVNG